MSKFLKVVLAIAVVVGVISISGPASAYTRPARTTVAAVQIVSATQTCVNGYDSVTLQVKNNTSAVFYADVYHSSEFTQNQYQFDTWADINPGETATLTFYPGYPQNLDLVVADDLAYPTVKVVASKELPSPTCTHSW